MKVLAIVILLLFASTSANSTKLRPASSPEKIVVNPTHKPKADSIPQDVVEPKKEVVKDAVRKKIKDAPDEDSSKKILRVLGWIFIISGVIILIALSIIGGVIDIVLGLIFLAFGMKGGKSKNKSGELQEVVYLKNGSVIRGTIIEQIPGISLKIQTADGNIFFYKMEEVEKITKEPSK